MGICFLLAQLEGVFAWGGCPGAQRRMPLGRCSSAGRNGWCLCLCHRSPGRCSRWAKETGPRTRAWYQDVTAQQCYLIVQGRYMHVVSTQTADVTRRLTGNLTRIVV